jgi:hypothetical protein
MKGGYGDTKQELEQKIKYIQDVIKILIANDSTETKILTTF